METRIALGLATTGTIKTKTVFSILRMMKRSKLDWDIITKESSILHYNREHICQQAIEGGASHVLFIDSDMQFEWDAAEKLLKHNKDIIGVPYNMRELPLKTTMKIHAEDGIIQEAHGDLMKIAAVATGFMLIKTSVFPKLTKPWFFWEFDGEVRMGEDVFFCRNARNAGFEIWADLSQKVGHIGDYIF